MKKLIVLMPLFVFICILIWGCGPAAEQEFDVRAHYDKSEYKIPMRDGIKLHTVVYSPRDKSQECPILMVRTPYSADPYGADLFHPPERMAAAIWCTLA